MSRVFAIEAADAPEGALPAKIGGEPAATPRPACRHCGKPMRFLFQLPHRPEVALDLAPARGVAVFQCENDQTRCESWSAESGANAVVTISDPPPPPRTDAGIPLRFSPADEDAAALSIDPDRATDAQLEAKDRAAEAAPKSKAGGVPIWPQGDETPSCHGAPMRFVAQLHGDSFGLTFGDGGTGFVFRCARDGAFKFLWQGY